MKIAYFDLFSGLSGDMTLGADVCGFGLQFFRCLLLKPCASCNGICRKKIAW